MWLRQIAQLSTTMSERRGVEREEGGVVSQHRCGVVAFAGNADDQRVVHVPHAQSATAFHFFTSKRFCTGSGSAAASAPPPTAVSASGSFDSEAIESSLGDTVLELKTSTLDKPANQPQPSAWEPSHDQLSSFESLFQQCTIVLSQPGRREAIWRLIGAGIAHATL